MNKIIKIKYYGNWVLTICFIGYCFLELLTNFYPLKLLLCWGVILGLKHFDYLQIIKKRDLEK